ncbi:calcium-transporting ATPase 12, plasma membrane-type-like [Olea europaea subsp. europaea]|uniref:Calcium-transporting ATPase 12, plasma membrane-type-like n=1 Tax=Olea europaea subsp. europaea TaxID=158383 RepID=A0A8S0R8X3_OLEEU|nr:calcium-transporting ATPase 12, plasma membrane-type-like [Olea europaea subsp. europaea]
MLLALEIDMENGIRGDQTDIHSRKKSFGSNLLPESNLQKIFCRFVLKASRDPMIVVLFICAMLSLCFGIQKRGLRQGWQEGVTKILAILVVVIVSSSGKFWRTSQFIEISKISSYISETNVVRSGKWQRIPICHVVVGEIVFLKPVVDGYARMLVTVVDKNVKHKHRWIYFEDPLLDELRKITSIVGKIYDDNEKRVSFGGETRIGDVLVVIVGILATPTMIALTSSPKDLVSDFITCLAYSVRKLMKIKILVGGPPIYDVVAYVTTVCMNKTGTLTMDSMKVLLFLSQPT